MCACVHVCVCAIQAVAKGCVVYRGVRYTGVCSIQGCVVYRGVRYTEVCGIQGCVVYRGVRYTGVCGTGVCGIQGCAVYGVFWCVQFKLTVPKGGCVMDLCRVLSNYVSVPPERVSACCF